MSQPAAFLELIADNSIYIIGMQAAVILLLLAYIALLRKKPVTRLPDQSPGLLNLASTVSDADTVRVLEINTEGLILSSNFYPHGSKRTLVGVNIKEVFEESLLKKRMANIQLAFQENRVINTSLTYRNRIFSSSIIPIFRNGKPERVMVISRDVTDSTKRDITFQESINQFKTVTRALPGTIFRIDLQSTSNPLVFISEQIEDLTGYAADDFLSARLSFYGLMIPADFNRVTRLLSKNIGTEEIDIEYRITHASGEIRWVLHKARITTDEEGKPKWKDGILLDITRQRKTEEARDLAYQIIDNISLLHSTLTTEKSKTEIFIQALGQLKELTKSTFSGIGEVFHDVAGDAQLKSWIVCNDTYGEKLDNQKTGDCASKNDELNQWISEIRRTGDVLLIKKEPKPASSPTDLQTFMGLPVKSGKILVAIVWLANKHDGYGAYDVKLLKPILKTLGVMLGNLREQQRRKRTEHKVLDLNLALKQFKFALNNTSIVSITDLEGKIKYANQKFSRISQYSRNELIGQNHRIINSSYHGKSFWKDMWKTIHAGNLWRGEVQNRAKDGSLYWVDTFIIPILDSQRKIIEFMSIRNDITEKKKHEAELKVLSLVARETSNYVLIADADCKIEWVNKSFENGMGYSLSELEGRDVIQLLELDQTNPSLTTFINNSHKDQRAFTCEFPVHAGNGQLLWLQMNCQPIQDEKGLTVRYFALLQNISEQKKLIASLEDARHKAEESDRLKSSFLANVSHEIRTPMNAIMGFSELLQRQGVEENKRNEFTKLIRQSSQELLTIVTDILDISKIEAGQMSSDFSVGNVQHMIEQLAAHYSAQVQWIHNKPIEIITFNHLPLHESTIRADFNHLQQVLNNLISNAIKFTNQGVIEFGCTRGIENMLVFSVRDTGIGISEEYHELIFKPFRQINRSQNLKIAGTGLGLAIAKGLVTLWGGEISVSSDGKKGSQFSFTIPYLPS